MTAFNVDDHAKFTLRMIEQGGLDAHLDFFAAATVRRRSLLREAMNGQRFAIPTVVQAAQEALARVSKFKPGDLAKVVSNRASYATCGVVGVVVKVNATTLWLGPPFPMYPNLKAQWDCSRLSGFQKLKGCKVAIDHCEHHIE